MACHYHISISANLFIIFNFIFTAFFVASHYGEKQGMSTHDGVIGDLGLFIIFNVIFTASFMASYFGEKQGMSIHDDVIRDLRC
ncbi:hypothetical protein B296_00046703 [Ensete ventricosum]|uniref:Uncharacterized protein n=1 Tax=Ensete ventricosum TaxID=4639 RepID=A0A426Z2X2_ENSVE|nr:hypothetical protein B296_00046703 [Ensete ventricosum]